MTRRDRRLELPAHWASTGGLWLDAAGLHGGVFDGQVYRIMIFEGVRVIAADVSGWGVAEVVACLVHHETPRNVEPRLSWLSDAELAPLIACGALTSIERLRLLSHVPGWQP